MDNKSSISPVNKSGKMENIATITGLQSRALIALIAGILLGSFIPSSMAHGVVIRVIMGWDVAVLMFIFLKIGIILHATPAQIRALSVSERHDTAMLVWVVGLAALMSLGAIVLELGEVKRMEGLAKGIHVALVILTLILSWSLIQLMFALHYTRGYYLGVAENGRGGIEIPGETEPDYLDFLYVSCVIGTSMQTADVPFTTRAMRRTALVHGILAFFFNACLVALIINISSGLI